MKNEIQFLNQTTFESSSSRTPEYLAWHRSFKKAFTKFLNNHGATEIQINKPNHFNMSGFFKSRHGEIWYFSISDIRWSKESMLIRTANSFKDYTGGRNQFIPFERPYEFEDRFNYVINNG
jgi:hypothetical protein